MEPASEARGMIQRIHSALKTLSRVRVLVLSNCISVTKDLAVDPVSGLPVSCEIWDLERLYRSMAAGLPREDITIDFEAMFGISLPCVRGPESEGHQSYLVVLPGAVLARLYQDYGARLLEYNVRAFLQPTGKVNRGIRDTLRTQPERFMAYNNGISATVDELDTVLQDGQLAIRQVRGLQIVNGGQTTASLHRAGRRDGVDLAAVSVPTKITVVRRDLVDEIVPRISLYANTQNVVQMADFSANESFHVEFERLAGTIWCPGERGRWFYERARGQYQVARSKATTPAQLRRFSEQTPPQRMISKTELARHLNAWDQLPYAVNSGPQKNFVRFMRDLRQGRGRDWLPDEAYYRDAISKVILFKAADRVVRRSELKGYRSKVSTYLVAYMSRRSAGRLDLGQLWRNQALSPELEALLVDWTIPIAEAIRHSAGLLDVTEWCKKDGCWEAVARLELAMPTVLPSELAGVPLDGSDPQAVFMSPAAYDDLAEVKRLSADEWFAVHAWGQSSGLLAAWQVGIAHTLSGYATASWRREPSLKQAKQGVRIIAIARDHGQLPTLVRHDAQASS